MFIVIAYNRIFLGSSFYLAKLYVFKIQSLLLSLRFLNKIKA